MCRKKLTRELVRCPLLDGDTLETFAHRDELCGHSAGHGRERFYLLDFCLRLCITSKLVLVGLASCIFALLAQVFRDNLVDDGYARTAAKHGQD